MPGMITPIDDQDIRRYTAPVVGADKPPLRQIPQKLRRLQAIELGLSTRRDDLSARRKQVQTEMRRLRQDVEALNQEWGWADKNNPKIGAEKKKCEASITELEVILEEVQAELAEISSDHDPLRRTVQALEGHLGLERGQQFFYPQEFRINQTSHGQANQAAKAREARAGNTPTLTEAKGKS